MTRAGVAWQARRLRPRRLRARAGLRQAAAAVRRADRRLPARPGPAGADARRTSPRRPCLCARLAAAAAEAGRLTRRALGAGQGASARCGCGRPSAGRASCSAATASCWSTRSAGSSPTPRRSTPTRAPREMQHARSSAAPSPSFSAAIDLSPAPEAAAGSARCGGRGAGVGDESGHQQRRPSRAPPERLWLPRGPRSRFRTGRWCRMARRLRSAYPSIDEPPGPRERPARERRHRLHSGGSRAADRSDPVGLLERQDATREPDLVPVRHGRMMVSPFTFYRGAAKIMAADLADDAGGRAGGPAVRRCAPVELRRVRLARAQAAVRPERLRRDAAGAVRVRREADGGELHDRGPQQRVRQGGHARGDAGVGAGLPGGDGLVRADGDDGHLVRPPGRGRAQWPRSAARWPGRSQDEGGEEGQASEEAGEKAAKQEAKAAKAAQKRAAKTAAEGAHPRQRAGAVKLGELVDGKYRIVSQPPIVVPARDLDRHLRPVPPIRSTR